MLRRLYALFLKNRRTRALYGETLIAEVKACWQPTVRDKGTR